MEVPSRNQRSPRIDSQRVEDDEIRERLRALVEEHAQAKVARRTHTPQPSLSGYLRGRRIPADFCARIIREFGVNPNWLLTGEGAQYRSDVSGDVEKTGSNLLALIEAMDAVTRMTIGSLIGNDQRELLRNLNTRLAAHETLQASLEEQVRPVFEKLLDDLTRSLLADAADTDSLLAASTQISRLCKDPHLLTRYEGLRAAIESARGNRLASLDARQQLFRRNFLEPQLNHSQFMEDTNYAASLYHNFRIREAYRVMTALIALRADQSDHEGYWQYMFTAGLTAAQLGNIEEALELLQRAYPRVPKENRLFDYPNLLNCLLLAGTMDLAEAVAAEQARVAEAEKTARLGSYAALTRFGISFDLCHLLEPIAAISIPWLENEESTSGDLLGIQHRVLLGQLSLKAYLNSDSIQQHLESRYRRDRAIGNVFAAQAARSTEDPKAKKFHEVAKNEFGSFEPEEDPPILLRFLHARNGLLLYSPGEPEHDEGGQVLRTHLKQGYGCLRTLPEITPQ